MAADSAARKPVLFRPALTCLCTVWLAFLCLGIPDSVGGSFGGKKSRLYRICFVTGDDGSKGSRVKIGLQYSTLEIIWAFVGNGYIDLEPWRRQCFDVTAYGYSHSVPVQAIFAGRTDYGNDKYWKLRAVILFSDAKSFACSYDYAVNVRDTIAPRFPCKRIYYKE